MCVVVIVCNIGVVFETQVHAVNTDSSSSTPLIPDALSKYLNGPASDLVYLDLLPNQVVVFNLVNVHHTYSHEKARKITDWTQKQLHCDRSHEFPMRVTNTHKNNFAI